MRKITASFFGVFLLAAPALALADAGISPMQSVRQLMAVVAALKAQEAALVGQPIACAAVASKATVRVDEPFVLAWGSVGAMNPGDDPSRSMFEPNGASIVAIQKSGKWEYTFKFYGRGGEVAECSARITVTR